MYTVDLCSRIRLARCRGGKSIRQTQAVLRSGRLVFDPLHYLSLIERKVGALDQAAPLAGWKLPQQSDTLRHLMESRMDKRGKREYVQV